MDNKIIVGSEELTKILGYKNRNYISELVNDFNMPKVNFNEFDLYEVIPWHVEHLKNIHRKQIDLIKAEKPQDDLARKNAVLKQMEIEEREGNLISKETHAEVLLNFFTVFRTGILTIGANAATDLIDKQDTKEIIEIINKQANKILTNIAQIGKILEYKENKNEANS